MDYFLTIAVLATIFGIFAASLNLQLGYAGLYNLGQVAFFGVGAYTTALLTTNGLPIPLGIAAAMVMAAVVGGLIAYPFLRLTGDYFGIATLAFAEMARLIFLNERWLTKGPMGIPGIPKPLWLGLPYGSMIQFLVIALGFAVLAFAFLAVVQRSPFGRTLKLIREDEHVAGAFGKNVLWFKVRCVMVSASVAGLAGALWAHYLTYISPNDFTLQTTILILLVVVLGGRGTFWGPIVGAVAVISIQEAIRFIPFPAEMARHIAPIQGIVFGTALIVLMIKRPQGIVAEHRD